MKKKLLLIAILVLIVLFITGGTSVFAQQPTFGPSCTPSPRPTFGPTCSPSPLPRPTTPPALPVTAGLTGLNSLIIILGLVALLSGVGVYFFSTVKTRRQR